MNALQNHVGPAIDQRELNLGRATGLKEPAQELAQRLHDREQLGPEDMALVHVDDTVRPFGIEPDDRVLADFQRPQSRTTSGAWR